MQCVRRAIIGLAVAHDVAREPRGSRRAAIAIEIDRPEIRVRRSDAEDCCPRLRDGEALQRSVSNGVTTAAAPIAVPATASSPIRKMRPLSAAAFPIQTTASSAGVNLGWLAEWPGVSSRGVPPAASTIQIASSLRPVRHSKRDEAPVMRPRGMIVAAGWLAEVRQLTAVTAITIHRPQHLQPGEPSFVGRVNESLAVGRRCRTGSSIDHLLRRPSRRRHNRHSASPPRMKGNPASVR